MLVEEGPHLALGQRTHEAVDRAAVLEQDHRGDAADAEGAGELLLVVRVDLHQLEGAAVVGFELLQDGAERLAGAAPRGPEIHQHRLGGGGGDHLLFEVGDGDVDHARGPSWS
ncbi:hypothetical protein FQZ97_1112580 [compost metagenome]